MYENVGEKIKSLAITIAVIEFLLTAIPGIILMATDESMILTGLIVIIVGFIVAWLSSLLLYGFGELIELTASNERNTRSILNLLKQKELSTPASANAPQGAKSEPLYTEESIVCPACNFKQPAYRTVCFHCGKSFKEEEKTEE